MSEFIKLPNGKIINLEHVRSVWRAGSLFEGQTFIDTGDRNGVLNIPTSYDDPDGEIYAYFESMARDITEPKKRWIDVVEFAKVGSKEQS